MEIRVCDKNSSPLFKKRNKNNGNQSLWQELKSFFNNLFPTTFSLDPCRFISTLSVYYTWSLDPCRSIVPDLLNPAGLLYLISWPLSVYCTFSLDLVGLWSIVPDLLTPAGLLYLISWPLPVYCTWSLDPCRSIVPVPLTPAGLLYLFFWPQPVYCTCSVDPCRSDSSIVYFWAHNLIQNVLFNLDQIFIFINQLEI